MDYIPTIVFFGEDSFSNIVLTSLIKAGYTVPLVVSPYYNNVIHKRLELTARNNNSDYIREKNVNSEIVVEKVKKIQPDLLITAHVSRLIRKELISIPSIGCLNLHPSLLPFYRGMSPQHWPIINGDKKTGITIHFIDEGIDTGNIVLQREIDLSENMYVSDLQLVWAREYQTIMCDAITLITSSITYKNGISQKKDEGSFFGKLRPEECEIKIDDGIRRAYNLIRGVSMPYYGAYIYHENNKIILWRAEIVSNKPESAVGNIITNNGNVYLSFKDGTLLITKYQIIPSTGV